MTLGSCGCSKRYALLKGINETLPYFLHVLPLRIKSDKEDASKTIKTLYYPTDAQIYNS